MTATPPPDVPSSFSAHTSSSSPVIVALGGSAGAIGALKAFFEALPRDAHLACVVLVHQPDDYDTALTEVLQASTSWPVSLLDEPTTVEAQSVYVMPPGRALRVENPKGT